MSRLELSIAWRYLRSRRGSRLLSIISTIAIGGVMVGVSALVLITSVMTGLQHEMRDRILIGSPDVRLLTDGDMRIDGWRDARRRVTERPGVVAAGPVAITEVVARRPKTGDPEGMLVAGIEPMAPGVAEPTDIRRHATAGDFTFRTTGGGERGLVLGHSLARRLTIGVGDSLTLYGMGTGQVNPVTGSPIYVALRLEVTGIFETGLFEYDDKFIFAALPVAQELAGLGDAVTAIEVRVSDRELSGAVAADLAAQFGPGHHAVDWRERNRDLFRALELQKLGMAIILLLIVLVAAFNIVGTLTMVVTDKTREIGILKAMGMRPGAIRRIFLVQGVVIGLVGSLLGVALGLVTAWLVGTLELISLDPTIYFIDHLPVRVVPMDVGLVLAASLAIAALATLYPAGRAARLQPIDAIRQD